MGKGQVERGSNVRDATMAQGCQHPGRLAKAGLAIPIDECVLFCVRGATVCDEWDLPLPQKGHALILKARPHDDERIRSPAIDQSAVRFHLRRPARGWEK